MTTPTFSRYASIEWADAYWVFYGSPTAWSGLANAQKEEALLEATDFVDQRYAGMWKGVRYTDDQPRAWPRSGVRGHDGYAIDNTTVPDDIRNATSYLALRYIQKGGTLMPDVSEPGAVTARRSKIGEIEEEIEYETSTPAGDTDVYPKIDAMLSRYIYGQGKVVLA